MSASDKVGWFARIKVAFSRKKDRSKQPTFIQRVKLFWKPKADGSVANSISHSVPFIELVTISFTPRSVAPASSANANFGRRQLNNRPRSFQAGNINS